MSILKYKNNKSFLLIVLFAALIFINGTDFFDESDVIIEQVPLEGNNIRAWIYNTGIFNQDFRTTNTPGFEWPKGQMKYAVFTTGLSIGAYVNGQLREAMASYKGELAPGYIIDSSGLPKARTDVRFKIYNVKRTDNWINNQYWLNWGLMVPFGAPFVDVNNDGVYEPVIDTPGIRGAEQTLFVCMTDGFPEEHKIGEGFGGGTPPLFAEIRLTAWAYNIDGLKDVQFLKWEVINKNNSSWNGAYFSIITDTDLGFADDDYIGCDTARDMGFGYNCDNDDAGNIYSYGINPPAVGFDLLKGAMDKTYNFALNLGMTSCCIFHSHYSSCENDPNGEPLSAYRYMQGYKMDGTPWLDPTFNPPKKTKYTFSGDPETNYGWTEFKGRIFNCGGDTTGNVVPSNCGDKKFIISSGADNFTVNPGDTQVVMIAQFIARGTSNLNSVTRLKQLSDFVQSFVDNGFVIGVKPVSSEIPGSFKLYQNYPNPFNPSTSIKFDIPQQHDMFTKLKIYDILGKEIATLVNEELKPGSYQVRWDATGFSSGVYYYKLIIGDPSASSGQSYSQTKKMVVIK